MSDEVLFSFKAGRVQLNQETGEATPLRGQGKVVLKQSSEDLSLRAIQWVPRASYLTMEPSEELMVLPGDVEFEHVPECKTGRVISLKFMSSGDKILYWLQDPPHGNLDDLTANDKEIIEKLNDLANESIEEEELEAEAEGEELPDADDSGLVAEPAQREPDSNDSLSVASARIIEQLQRQAQSQTQGQNQQASLARALGPSVLARHIAGLSDTEVARLLELVPQVASSREELMAVVRSPHLSRSLGELTAAIYQGGTGLISQQSGVPYKGEGVEAYLWSVWNAVHEGDQDQDQPQSEQHQNDAE